MEGESTDSASLGQPDIRTLRGPHEFIGRESSPPVERKGKVGSA